MGIRGVQPSFGATGPSDDPKADAKKDLSDLIDLVDKLRQDLQNKDINAAQKDIAQMNRLFNDLNKIAPKLPAPIQGQIKDAIEEFQNIAGNLEQVSPEELNKFEAQLDQIRQNL